MQAIGSPFPTFTDTDGSPLDGGSVYFGTVALNPETAPITVYWDLAGTQPAAQPLKTSNGYVVRSGTPSQVYCPSDFSMTVRNAKGALVSYSGNSPNFYAVNLASMWGSNFPGTPTYVDATHFTLVGNQTASFPVGTRVRSAVTAGFAYSTVSAAVFGAVTTITLVNDSTALDSGLSAVALSIATIAEQAVGLAATSFQQTVPYAAGSAGLALKNAGTRLTALEVPPLTTGTSTAYAFTQALASATLAAGVWIVHFHVASGASPTLNISALGSKALKQYDATGAKVAAVIPLNLVSLVWYDGTDLIVGNPLPTSIDGSSGVVVLSALASFAQSLGASGYQKLPGGLILQWGTQVVGIASSAVFTWPIAFPANLYSAQITVKNNPYSTLIECDLTCTAQSLTNLTITNEYIGDSTGTQNALTAQIFAIGN